MAASKKSARAKAPAGAKGAPAPAAEAAPVPVPVPAKRRGRRPSKSPAKGRAEARHKTSINLSEEAITLMDEILSAEGGFSRSTVIERAIRAFHQSNPAVQAAIASRPHREVR